MAVIDPRGAGVEIAWSGRGGEGEEGGKEEEEGGGVYGVHFRFGVW